MLSSSDTSSPPPVHRTAAFPFPTPLPVDTVTLASWLLGQCVSDSRCDLCIAFVPHSCRIHAAFVPHSCRIRAAFVPQSCRIRAAFVPPCPLGQCVSDSRRHLCIAFVPHSCCHSCFFVQLSGFVLSIWQSRSIWVAFASPCGVRVPRCTFATVCAVLIVPF